MDRVPFHNRPKVVDLTTETKLADGIKELQLMCGKVRRSIAQLSRCSRHVRRVLGCLTTSSRLGCRSSRCEPQPTPALA